MLLVECFVHSGFCSNYFLLGFQYFVLGQSVGGALTVAKSAVSSWFSMLAQPTAEVSASPQSAD